MCIFDGDCEHCPYPDCVATEMQAAKFYNREEQSCKKRYGRELVKQVLKREQKNELYLLQKQYKSDRLKKH